MALQGKITTKRSLAASGSSQKRIEAQKILLTSILFWLLPEAAKLLFVVIFPCNAITVLLLR
jgi:hypothetical protein